MCKSRRVKSILACASVLVVSASAFANTTDTWTGTVPITSTATYPANTAQWNTTDANWRNGGTNLFTAGDNVVFTDNFSGLTTIAVSGSMNPSSMSFVDIAGSAPVHYLFLSTAELANGGYTGGSSTPFNASTPTPFTLTLDPNFQGTVELSARATSTIDLGNTTVNSGTLELDDAGAIPPFTTNNNPSITLAGGTLEINITATDDNNTQASSSQLAGIMTVASSSTLELAADVANNSRVYNGTIALTNSSTLFFNSLTVANEMDCAATITGTGTISLGSTNTVLRLDQSKGLGGDANATYDLGSGSGILRNNVANGGTLSLGALTGGPNTFLDGSEVANAATTYAIGSLASSTYQGTIRNEPTTTGTVSITKVGTSTLTLTNSGNSYTGVTTVNQGTLAGTAASGTPFGVGNIALNGGVLSVAPAGSGSAVDISGANTTATTQFTYGGGGTLSLSKGTQSSVAFDVGNSAETTGTLIIARSGAGSLVIAPSGGTGTSNLGTSEIFLVNSTTAGNIPVMTNGIVNTSIVGQNNDANLSGDFLNYDPVKGFILANYGDTNFGTPSNTVTELVTAPQSSLASQSVFALNAEANIGLASGSTLTIGNSGSGAGQSPQAGLILNGATISGAGGTLAFGAAEGTVYTSAANGTISIPITGNGGLTTFGPGALSLSGNLAETGTTNIDAGTVILSGDNSGEGTAKVNVSQNATLQLQANAGNTTAGVTTVLSVTSTQLQLGNNSTLQLRADAPTTFFDTTATNAISMNGNTVNIDVNQLTGAGTNNTLTLDPAGFTAGGSTINVTGGNGYNLALGVITNPTNTTIDTLNPTTANVNLAGFTASLSANTHATLALSGTSTANTVSGIITDNSGASFTVALIKSGTSVWTLSGANTYTGGTTINAGVLSLNNSGALGSSGGIVFNGGTLQFSGNNNTDYSSRITISDGDTATLDTNNVNVTLGTALTLGNAKSGALAKVGAGTIDITAANLFTGGTTVNGGTVVLGITGALASGSNVANNAALEVSAATTLGNVSGTGTTTVDATQSLTANNFSQAGGLVNNGTTQINGNGTVGPISGAGTLVVGSGTSANTLKLATGSGLNTQTSLSIAAGATLDVNNDHFIINYGAGSDPISAIYGDLKSGYNGGTWNGPGIISSAARTPTNLLHYGVGFADGNDGTHAVAGLTSGEIELKYTLLGDANLDGTVNGSDFSILAANFGLGVTNWDQGNFLYGPSVNGSDFSALAANFGQGDSGAAGSVSQADISALDAFAAANDLSMPTISAVPEPASVGLLIAASAGMLSRRRRRS